MINQRPAARQALNMRQGKAVNHSCGGYGINLRIVRALAEAVEAGKPQWHARSLGEIHQRLPLVVQPLLMGGRSQPAFVGTREIGHVPPVGFLLFSARRLRDWLKS